MNSKSNNQDETEPTDPVQVFSYQKSYRWMIFVGCLIFPFFEPLLAGAALGHALGYGCFDNMPVNTGIWGLAIALSGFALAGIPVCFIVLFTVHRWRIEIGPDYIEKIEVRRRRVRFDDIKSIRWPKDPVDSPRFKLLRGKGFWLGLWIDLRYFDRQAKTAIVRALHDRVPEERQESWGTYWAIIWPWFDKPDDSPETKEMVTRRRLPIHIVAVTMLLSVWAMLGTIKLGCVAGEWAFDDTRPIIVSLIGMTLVTLYGWWMMLYLNKKQRPGRFWLQHDAHAHEELKRGPNWLLIGILLLVILAFPVTTGLFLYSQLYYLQWFADHGEMTARATAIAIVVGTMLMFASGLFHSPNIKSQHKRQQDLAELAYQELYLGQSNNSSSIET